MTNNEFLQRLRTATTVAGVEEAISEFETTNGSAASWVPLGNRQNNRGSVEISADPGRAMVERVTNGIDAVLEAEHEKHNGLPHCRNPRMAAEAWLKVPDEGLSGMTPSDRRKLARAVTVTLLAGDTKTSRTIEVRDAGIGLSAEQMPSTILSLNESNKMQKHYLAGAYGQGGSTTFASSSASLIASRRGSDEKVAFTVVRFEDLPPEDYKTGHYVYLTLRGEVPQAQVRADDFSAGTLVRHFGYDLSSYGSPVGPASVYGLLNKTLFDPVMPVWLDDQLHDYRRVIKGSRNALNGAVDEGDDRRTGPRLSHHMPMLYIPLGESGHVGIEYWVLDAPEKENKKPTNAFVNSAKPIVLTLNGQTHEELGQSLIRKEVDLPYLTQRLICHIDCNSLTPTALRSLFVSNREGARKGYLLDRIKEEVINALKSDDELSRLNAEAKQQSLKQRDESAIVEARKEVAKLLRAQGFSLPERLGGAPTRLGDDIRPSQPPPPPSPPKTIELREPPTYIHLIWPEDKEIPFHADQRRYLRIETDADGSYFDPRNPHTTRVNFIVADGEIVFRTGTPLKGGRMRGVFDCPSGARVGGKGTITVELHRSGLPTVSDSREFNIVERPKVKEDDRKSNLPLFDLRAISREDPMWETLGWPDDVAEVASSAEMEGHLHVVYYSTDFPRFKARYASFERIRPSACAVISEPLWHLACRSFTNILRPATSATPRRRRR